MESTAFAHFDTPIGRCTLVWGEQGVLALDLPAIVAEAPVPRHGRRHGQPRESPPTRAIQEAIDQVVALLQGEQIALSGIVLDLRGVPAFDRRVYALARQIPPGFTRTYGEIANQLGEPGAARAVGRALGHNPFTLIVPCHRVLAASGHAGGFSAPGGVATKRRLLLIEGARIGSEPSLFDA